MHYTYYHMPNSTSFAILVATLESSDLLIISLNMGHRVSFILALTCTEPCYLYQIAFFFDFDFWLFQI
jgi:hypothetical protein